MLLIVFLSLQLHDLRSKLIFRHITCRWNIFPELIVSYFTKQRWSVLILYSAIRCHFFPDHAQGGSHILSQEAQIRCPLKSAPRPLLPTDLLTSSSSTIAYRHWLLESHKSMGYKSILLLPWSFCWFQHDVHVQTWVLYWKHIQCTSSNHWSWDQHPMAHRKISRIPCFDG